MKRVAVILLFLFSACKQAEKEPLAPAPQTETPAAVPSPSEPPKPTPSTAHIKRERKPRPVVKSEPKEREKEVVTPPPEEKPVEQKEEVKEPSEEAVKRANNTVFEESFGWRAMNAIPIEAPPKHPDSLKWEDISGGPGAYTPPPTPWWVTWLMYINMAAAVILCGYLLITNG